MLFKFDESSTVMRFRKDPELGMDVEEGDHPNPDIVMEMVMGEPGEKPKMVNFSIWGMFKDRYITRKIPKKGMHDMMVFAKLIMPEFELYSVEDSLYMKMKMVF